MRGFTLCPIKIAYRVGLMTSDFSNCMYFLKELEENLDEKGKEKLKSLTTMFENFESSLDLEEIISNSETPIGFN